MASTPFSNDMKAFSDEAHMAARKLIYPKLFSTLETNITYAKQEDIMTDRGGALDADLSIDRVVKVSVSGLRMPLVFTFQERFRSPYYAGWQDITLTEWNPASNTPSELYKISANFFLYGYYNKVSKTFIDAINVNVPNMMLSIVTKQLDFKRDTNKRTAQPFLCVKFDALHKANVVNYRMKPIIIPFEQETKSKAATLADITAGKSQIEILAMVSTLVEMAKGKAS